MTTAEICVAIMCDDCGCRLGAWAYPVKNDGPGISTVCLKCAEKRRADYAAKKGVEQ